MLTERFLAIALVGSDYLVANGSQRGASESLSYALSPISRSGSSAVADREYQTYMSLTSAPCR
jgi:hypothetical protein